MRAAAFAAAVLALNATMNGPAFAQDAAEAKKPDFQPFAEVAKDYKQINNSEQPSLYGLWVREKDSQMLVELPRNFENQRHFIAVTVAGGETYAGLQVGDMYCYWKRFDKRLALIEPNVEIRSTGDDESKNSVQRLFTDRVVLDVPIVCMGPNNQPMIDMDDLLVGSAGKFFGRQASGANTRLATIAESKAFPENVELAFQMPVGNGQLRTFHYSISRIPENTGYKPREADERVGYFTTGYSDLGVFRSDKVFKRYINRWHLEKADAKLKLSPPKQPIVFYVEHTVPVRYRRWVRDGILHWNKAFEKVGIVNAIEVYQQDKASNQHMDKDPEDVRYNFVRWLSNNQGTAIGPSRVDPRTGQILDADIILTDGFIRGYWKDYNELIPEVMMQGFGPDTLAWLERRPQWDPRIRLAAPSQRDYLLAQRAQRGVLKYGGHPAGADASALMGEGEYDGLGGRTSQMNGMCMAARGAAMNMSLMRLHAEIADLAEVGEFAGITDDKDDAKAEEKDKDKAEKKDKKDDGEKKDETADADKEGKDKGEKKEKADLLDGVPEWFVGPLLADVTCHEVGHTLGLRHNFKGSTVYSMSEMNSATMRGAKTWSNSVMEYAPLNVRVESGDRQGDYSPIDIGPYDLWAIEFGYTTDDTAKVLSRVAEPELAYATDEDTWGPDPSARRWDLGSDPLEYAKEQVRLAKYHRERLIEKFVKNGDSWSRARRGYSLSLWQQTSAVSMMSGWIGGAKVYRDKKGDPNGRPPIEVVPAGTQRAALQFVIENAFRDDAYGLTPDLLKYLTVDKWWDAGGERDIFEDPTWPIHDRIMGIQAATLTQLMNPTTLKRVYDNEFRIPADQDMFTLAELMNTVTNAIWSEVDNRPSKNFSARQPMVASLRRNLQREHLERLIDLASPGGIDGAASKPISNLALAKLREIRAKIKPILDGDLKRMDDYTSSHLQEAALRIDKVLDAQYIYNTDKMGNGGGFPMILFGTQPQPSTEAQAPSMGTPE